MSRIVVLGAQPEYLSGLRGPMIRDLLAAGHEVIAIGAEEIGHVREALESWGARYLVVPLRRAAINPLADLKAIWLLWRTLRRLKPDLLLAYTIKPVSYGLPVAKAAGVKRRFAMIAGRGWAFAEGRERRRRATRFVATILYRFGLRFAHGVLFHNEDDMALFRERRLIGAGMPARRIFGSGVDLEHYAPAPMPAGPFTFLMISRLLIDKGVGEYLAAARALQARYPDAVFRLVGPPDPSPNGIPREAVFAAHREGAIDYAGPLTDVRPAIAACHCYVLPSYCEGLPRSVLEAMAMARPVITTDAPGCRDTVRDGETGVRVPARDAEALAEAMARFLENPAQAQSMGEAALAFARTQFDVHKVNRAIMDFIGLAR